MAASALPVRMGFHLPASVRRSVLVICVKIVIVSFGDPTLNKFEAFYSSTIVFSTNLNTLMLPVFAVILRLIRITVPRLLRLPLMQCKPAGLREQHNV